MQPFLSLLSLIVLLDCDRPLGLFLGACLTLDAFRLLGRPQTVSKETVGLPRPTRANQSVSLLELQYWSGHFTFESVDKC